jgi:hypothetical protein
MSRPRRPKDSVNMGSLIPKLKAVKVAYRTDPQSRVMITLRDVGELGVGGSMIIDDEEAVRSL